MAGLAIPRDAVVPLLVPSDSADIFHIHGVKADKDWDQVKMSQMEVVKRAIRLSILNEENKGKGRAVVMLLSI
jgi:hypothetical protein